MRKIKIAFVITRLDRGGAPDLVLSLINNLDPDRYDITLISGLTLYPARGITEIRNRDIKLIFLSCLRRKINPFLDTFALFRLCRIFKRTKFDIVHTHTAKAGILGRVAAKIAEVPKIIHSPHGHNFYGYFGPIGSSLAVVLERLVSCFTDRLIALTELEKKDFLDHKVATPEKIVVINSGLDLKRYKKTDKCNLKKREELLLHTDEIAVGMIGRLELIKGAEYFLEAACLVSKDFPEAKFLIVGDGRCKSDLESRCQKLGINDKFIFTGWKEDIPQILSILDILVLPSLNEAVGRVLLEAGACGVPVVATNVGGIPEIVRDNQTGILVPSQDPQGLACAIISLLKDKEKRHGMGEAAKRWIDERFSTEVMVKKISSFYEELMANEKI